MVRSARASTTTLNLDLEKDEWKEFTKQPYRYQNQFDAAPGAYKLPWCSAPAATTSPV